MITSSKNLGEAMLTCDYTLLFYVKLLKAD
jgi:hypothetical protein